MSVPTGDAALPPGFQFRAATMADIPAVVAVWRAEEEAADGAAHTSEGGIAYYWRQPGRDFSANYWVVVDEQARVVGVLDAFDHAPGTSAEFTAAVHPAFHGRGIGSALLAQVEQVVSARCDARHGTGTSLAAPLAAQTKVSSTHGAAQRLFRAHGYAHVRDWREMTIDLTTDVRPVEVPDGLRFADFRPEQDARAVWETAEEAWQDHYNHTPASFETFMYYRVDAVEHFDNGLWIIAWDDDTNEIAGMCLCRIDRARGPEPRGWVSLLAVRRAWRGRGLGNTLMQAGFAAFRARGWQHAGLSVDGNSITRADRLYERMGMHEVHRSVIFEKVLREAPQPAVASTATI